MHIFVSQLEKVGQSAAQDLLPTHNTTNPIMAGASSAAAMAVAAARDPPWQVTHCQRPADLLSETRVSTVGPYLDTVQIRMQLKTGPACTAEPPPPPPERTAVAAALINDSCGSAAS